MKIIRYRLPISQQYDSPIIEGFALLLVLAILGGLVMDGGVSEASGIAVVAYCGGAAVLICRHPQAPTRLDLQLIRFGYPMVLLITFFIAAWICHLRGLL